MTKRKTISNLRLRNPEKEDISDLIFLENECFTEYYKDHRFDGSDFSVYLHDDKSIFFVAVSSNELIGYVAGMVKNLKSGRTALLESIAVVPEVRNTNVGGVLLEKFIKEARRLGCKSILLEVAADNEVGIRFFSKHKFQMTQELLNYYGEGFDGLKMKLEI